MENETTKEETEQKPKFDDKTLFLEKTEEFVKRNEKAVEEMRRLVERNEEIATRNLLGGQSDSIVDVTEPKVETPKDYVKKVMSGEIGYK